MLTVVNMIPKDWSDEQNQDCEPNLSVNPANPGQIIGTAFTYDNPAGSSAISPAMTANWAPLYYSTDGGNTWSLQFVLPSAADDQLPTWDVTARFGGTGGYVYSSLITPTTPALPYEILIGRAADAVTQQANIATASGDQPFMEATTALGGSGAGQDLVYIGHNVNNVTSTLTMCFDATAASPTFTSITPDSRNAINAAPTRTAIHIGGTVYCAFYSQNPGGSWSNADVVIVKDLNWGESPLPFQALVDPGDDKVGVQVATSISTPGYHVITSAFGNDRFGFDLAVAVDPNDDQRVYIAYATGTGVADYALHLVWSGDGGQTWSADVRTVPVAKNPSVAISTLGVVGFTYQQVVTTNWVTILEISDNGFATTFTPYTLASTPTDAPTPASHMGTYLGDYIKLQAIGKDFYGTFCASNSPMMPNFPSGITYQRNVDWSSQTLLGTDNVTPVPISIDPFFYVLTAVDPSLDFYVRDWTASPVSFDTGVEPSTNPIFYTTSDVWNQWSTAAPTFNANNQPNSEDAQIAAIGPNYAFARISRRAAAAAGAADVDVAAEFLFADFGLGVPYVDVSASATATTTFTATDMQLLTQGVAWTLPATHSQHVCIAVQISSPADPYQLPSLLGMSPGWGPSGSDTTVLNDNNKAQRNLGVYPVGQSAGRQLGQQQYYAVLHNAATFTRDMLVEYVGGMLGGEPSRAVSVSLFGGAATKLAAGEVLRVPGMLPGENRWLAIEVADIGASMQPSHHDFQEIFGGRRLSGFRVAAQPTTTTALVKWNTDAERALYARVHALFDRDPPPGIANAFKRLGGGSADDDDYFSFITDFVVKAKHFELLEVEIDLGPVDIDAHHRRLTGAVRRKHASAAAAGHANLLHQLDALLTMAQKGRGDAGDILLNLQWQRALYARATVELAVVNEVRQQSTEFTRAFQSRKATAKDFPGFIRRLVPEFEKTAQALGAPGRRLEPLVKRLARRPARGKTADPNTVQKEHRAFLMELQSLIL